MKISAFLLTLLFFFQWQLSVVAQEIELPEKYDFSKKGDRTDYESTVIESINWLEETPIEEEEDKRKKLNKFVMAWITATEKVVISLSDYQVKYFETNPSLLMTFMGGWSIYSLENPDDRDDEVLNADAGFKSVIKVYKKNLGSGMEQDKNLDKLVEMSDENLFKFIKKKTYK